ncbi:hypothetical protein Sango_1477300 [Sesamum angolense]|uniref:Uncharacterized protein n=1 Tax=Sesamum angolense TaxID=2727404 RepID=A0AAE2BSS0_9LAMI|nr:hypothetical protein Sango_1477300 [Sesamum angolense]
MAAKGLIRKEGEDLSCVGVQCYKLAFLIITATTMIGCFVSSILVIRTRKFYKGDIYKKFREQDISGSTANVEKRRSCSATRCPLESILCCETNSENSSLSRSSRPSDPYSNYAFSVMKHEDPIGSGLGKEAVVEAAGPDCLVPGLTAPIKLLGLKVWPIEMDLKFMEPVGRELKSIGRFMDSAVDLMNKSFIDR